MQILTKATSAKKYRLESEIERAGNKLIQRRWPEVLIRKLNGYGSAAWPDRMYLFRDGVAVFVEYKRPGEPLTPLQAETHRVLRNRGYVVCTADCPEQAVVFCEAAIENAKARHANETPKI